MAQINIKVNNVKSANKTLKTLSSNLADKKNRISNLHYAIDSSITRRRNIGPNLNNTVSSLKDLEKHIGQLQHFISESMERYEKADKKVDSQKLSKPDKKSIWDTIKGGASSVGNFVKGLGTGIADAVVSTLEGIWNVITHPIETAKGLIHVVTHPVETAKAIWDSIKNSWNNDVINGTAETRGNWFGRAFGEVALAVVGTKGVDKAVKLTKGVNVVEEAGGVRIDRISAVDEVAASRVDSKGVATTKIDESSGLHPNNGGIPNSIPNGSGLPPKTYKYNMIENPGPLAEIRGTPAANFYGGKYNIETLNDDVILYRSGKKGGLTIPGEEKNALGQWFTRAPAESVVQVRLDSAVKAQWIDPKTGALTGTSPIESTYAIKVPKGTTIYEGPVGYQGGPYLGGEDFLQIFVQEPWKIKGIEVISETPIK